MPDGVPTQEPLFWRAQPLKQYNEPEVPSADGACYIYAPSMDVVVIPYVGGPDRGFDPTAGSRPYRVAYYSNLRGRGIALRRRLYKLCEVASKGKPWMCWREFLKGDSECADGDSQCAAAPMFQRFQQSDFCFSPVGDGPLRTTVWQALRRGCIPVLFASCPHGSLAEAYNSYFLPRDTAPHFGVRKWSVLLNQTEVMRSDGYVADALNSITEAQLLGIRRRIRRYALRMSWFPNATARAEAQAWLASDDVLPGDALSFVVSHILKRQRGAPLQTSQRVPSDYALDYRPLASTDGRVCATKACTHRQQTGRRANYSLQFGPAGTETRLDQTPLQPSNGRPCIAKACTFAHARDHQHEGRRRV